MTIAPARRQLLMLGHTRGNRSAATCHFKCGDACAKSVPNTTDTTYFRDIASAALSRRNVLGGMGALTLVFAGDLPGGGSAAQAATGRHGGSGMLAFQPIAPVPNTVDALTVPRGYRWDPVIRWGDPILRHASDFDPENQTAESQAAQFGYNNDYLTIIETDRRGRRGLLVANHEFTNEELMFPAGTDPVVRAEVAIAAHGMSVVEVRRRRAGDVWEYEKHSRYNRRITASTPFTVDGPAAGSELLRTVADSEGMTVLGTLNNCAGGTTPWGTVLSGEENFNQYFVAAETPENLRYGIGAGGDTRGWAAVDPRFDATTPGYENEVNRFGWVVEIDPEQPNSMPVKHTALGRFKHEGATVALAPDGRAVVYMGDDERFDYVYKFVSSGVMAQGGRHHDDDDDDDDDDDENRDDEGRHGMDGRHHRDREHNKKLLSDGDLYVARFTGDGFEDGVSDGSGEWIPLVVDGKSQVPGFSIEEVLVFTRLAADAVSPTKMDRPEDVEPNPLNGRIYVACTNNDKRGVDDNPGVDEANPRTLNRDGHVVEVVEDDNDGRSLTFTWNLILICGGEDTAGTYFGGWTGPVSPISCPDNVAFDSEGNLWICTDGMPGTLGYNDGLYKVPVTGDERGRVQQFLAVPTGAETCGPVIDDEDGSVFVAVQHPGETDDSTYEAPSSLFPDYVGGRRRPGKGKFAIPRPSVVQVTRE